MSEVQGAPISTNEAVREQIEHSDQSLEGRSGASLVLGIIVFAMVMGLSGLSMRAYVRLRRGEQTAEQLLKKLATAGLFDAASIPSAPITAPLEPLSVASPSQDFERGLTACSERIFRGDLLERQAALIELDRFLDGLQPLELQAARALRSSALLTMLKRIESGEGLKESYRVTLARGLATLAEKDASYDAQGRIRSLFGRAQVADARATFIRVMATALEASHHPLHLALGAMRKTDEVVQKQRIRVAESLLLVFPELGASLEAEGRIRSRGAMLRIACEVSEGEESEWTRRIEAQLPKALDALTGQALRLSSGKDGRARIWSTYKHEIGLQLAAKFK